MCAQESRLYFCRKWVGVRNYINGTKKKEYVFSATAKKLRQEELGAKNVLRRTQKVVQNKGGNGEQKKEKKTTKTIGLQEKSESRKELVFIVGNRSQNQVNVSALTAG